MTSRMRSLLICLASGVALTLGCGTGSPANGGTGTGAQPNSAGGSAGVGGAPDSGGTTPGSGGDTPLPPATLCPVLGPAPRLAPATKPSASTADAQFDISQELSAEINTVGIITWTVDKPISAAVIEFGRSRAPEYVAPVDLDEPELRTLLLGMKQGQSYTYRVVATGCDGEVYVSEDQTIESGYLGNSLPTVISHQVDNAALDGGLIVSCNGYGNAQNIDPSGGNAWAFILDRDGDYVWAYNLRDTPVAGCSRARMSHDGQHMWLGNTSVFESNGALRRLSMDGLTLRDYSLPTRHHDFTVLPSGNILYFVQQSGVRVTEGDEGPDSIMELDIVSGDSSLIYDQTKDFGELLATTNGSHTNCITYVPELEAFSFSMLYSDTIALVSYPDGNLLGTFGGAQDEFGVSWNSQHGHQFLQDTFLVFNNWSTEGDSALLEFDYDLAAKTASNRQIYRPDPTIGTIAFGSVQRLPNGNTMVTFSSNGVIHEIDPSKNFLREISMSAALGLAQQRPYLYGPPPHLSGWPAN